MMGTFVLLALVTQSGFWYPRGIRTEASRDFWAPGHGGPAQRIVLRAMAGTEPTIVIALVGQRDAAEMGANPYHNKPSIMARFDASHRPATCSARLLTFRLTWQRNIGFQQSSIDVSLPAAERRILGSKYCPRRYRTPALVVKMRKI